MVDLPELAKDASESVSNAKNQARQRLSWLPDPYECPKCSVYCNAERCYQPQRAAFFEMGQAPCWTCPSCGSQYVREE